MYGTSPASTVTAFTSTLTDRSCTAGLRGHGRGGRRPGEPDIACKQHLLGEAIRSGQAHNGSQLTASEVPLRRPIPVTLDPAMTVRWAHLAPPVPDTATCQCSRGCQKLHMHYTVMRCYAGEVFPYRPPRDMISLRMGTRIWDWTEPVSLLPLTPCLPSPSTLLRVVFTLPARGSQR